MSIVENWAVKLAREVAPAEEPLAPTIARAFVEGGHARRDLFDGGGHTVGAFGSGGLSLILPAVLGALSLTGSSLGDLFKNKSLGDFLTCLKSWLSITEMKEKFRSRSAAREQKAPADAPPADAQARLQAAQAQAAKVEATNPEVQALKRVAHAICAELRARGLQDEQCDSIGYRVLLRLMEEPEGAGQFVRELAAAAPPATSP